LLAENTGHINYGPYFGKDFKGIVDGVTIDYQYQNNYRTYPLPLDDIARLTFASLHKLEEDRPSFYRGRFNVEVPMDTFLRFPGVRGVVWINGFNLGRYWNIGPGNTLYVPGPVLRRGENEVVVFELHKLTDAAIELTDKPCLS